MLPTVNNCTLINLPKIGDRNGHITSINNEFNIPFCTSRVFYLYDIQGGESRGAHAHINCHQFLCAVSGSFEVLLNDGVSERTFQLNKPNLGLYIPPGIWASELNFSSGAICLVLTSELFDERDYIRNFDEYINFRKRNG